MPTSPSAPQANPQQREVVTTGTGVVARSTVTQGRPVPSPIVTFPATAAQELTTRRVNRLIARGGYCTRNARYLGTCHASGR